MKILSRKALMAAVAITAASAANATVCTNPALNTLSSLTGTSAPTLACVNDGVDVVSPVTGSYNTKTQVSGQDVNSKTSQAVSDPQIGKTIGSESGPTQAMGGNSVGNIALGNGGLSAYRGVVKTGSLNQANTFTSYGAVIGSPTTMTNNGTTGTGNSVSGTLAGVNGNIGSQQTQASGPQTQVLATSQVNNSSNQAASKSGATAVQH